MTRREAFGGVVAGVVLGIVFVGLLAALPWVAAAGLVLR